ncbi:hypothetical protein EWM64_g145 [Hericium alpestre]|uniref:F-box domain-containing protein n=1 Tax=Hericium alpestre TaxID=135208 RepID=A0A4Z0ABT8_9AGAM|nr:hypothetical protein EWM64_g145 [Hericium alpestre]
MSRAEGPREVFGVIFSITHCAIIRIDRSGPGSFTHTPALPFLPSWDTTSAATPGITALARLAHLYDRQHYLRLLMVCGIEPPHMPPLPLPKDHILRQLPAEMLLRIIKYLPDTRDVISFGAACSETRVLVESIFSGGPVFQDCELISMSDKDKTTFAPPSEEDIQEAAENGDEIVDYEDYRYLTRASFEARHPEKGRVVLAIGLDENDRSLSGYRRVHFLGHEWKPNATSIDLSYQLSDLEGQPYRTEVKKWYFGAPSVLESAADDADDVNGSDGEDSDVDMDDEFLDALMQDIHDVM